MLWPRELGIPNPDNVMRGVCVEQLKEELLALTRHNKIDSINNIYKMLQPFIEDLAYRILNDETHKESTVSVVIRSCVNAHGYERFSSWREWRRAEDNMVDVLNEAILHKIDKLKIYKVARPVTCALMVLKNFRRNLNDRIKKDLSKAIDSVGIVNTIHEPLYFDTHPDHLAIKFIQENFTQYEQDIIECWRRGVSGRILIEKETTHPEISIRFEEKLIWKSLKSALRQMS